MNIFMLDQDVERSAIYHNNDHVRKQVVEYAQLLATAKRMRQGRAERVWIMARKNGALRLKNKEVFVIASDCFKTRFGMKILVKKEIPLNAYENHPCSIWTRESEGNYKYLYRLFVALNNEYYHRFGKFNKVCYYSFNLTHCPKMPKQDLTAMPLAMPEDCKDDDVVLAYRKYYNTYKRHLAFWSKRNPPPWYEV